MSTKTKGVPIPDVPDFRDYEHGFPATPKQLKTDMIYMSDRFDVLRITAVIKTAVACEILLFGDDMTLEWVEVNYMIPVRNLNPYTEESRQYMVERQAAAVVRAAQLKQQRKIQTAKRRKEQAETDFFAALGIAPTCVWFSGQKGQTVSINLRTAEYRKLKVLLRAARSEGL